MRRKKKKKVSYQNQIVQLGKKARNCYAETFFETTIPDVGNEEEVLNDHEYGNLLLLDTIFPITK